MPKPKVVYGVRGYVSLKRKILDISSSNMIYNDISGEITPHIGIGDLIHIKMREIANNFTVKIVNINEKLVNMYSSDAKQKIEFIKNLVQFMFPNAECHVNNKMIDFQPFCNKYPLSHVYLYDHLNTALFKPIENPYTNYIVFHTKLRHDNLIDRFNSEMRDNLQIFLKRYKSNSQVIIVGEKEIGVNKETTLHKTLSLYNDLLLLKENNDVIDLTTRILTEGNDFNSFLYDIQLINNARCNITFGIGGPFSITTAFCKKNIAFIPFLDNCIYKITCTQMHDNICKTIEDLGMKLDEII